MKIYIVTDMEGVSGLHMMEQVYRDSPEYIPACGLLMDDVNVAVAAAFDAGATDVVVCDAHGGGGQIHRERMDPRAQYVTPDAGAMMPCLDESFAGVILLGQHARAGTLNAFLDHTVSSAQWFEFRINDLVVGEIGIVAAYSGHFNVPVIALTGDKAAAAEAKELLGDIECAVVKRGLGRNRAECLSIPEAHVRIREVIHAAVNSAQQFNPWKPYLPATIQLTLYRSDMADDFATKPDVERVDARTVRKSISSFKDVVAW